MSPARGVCAHRTCSAPRRAGGGGGACAGSHKGDCPVSSRWSGTAASTFRLLVSASQPPLASSRDPVSPACRWRREAVGVRHGRGHVVPAEPRPRDPGSRTPRAPPPSPSRACSQLSSSRPPPPPPAGTLWGQEDRGQEQGTAPRPRRPPLPRTRGPSSSLWERVDVGRAGPGREEQTWGWGGGVLTPES